MRGILTGILFILFTSHAHAAWYQVELIIFEHLYPDAGGEQWFNNQDIPDITKSIELVTEPPVNNQTLIPFLILPKSSYKLGGVYNVLRLSKEYHPSLHTSWQQPGLTRSRAKYIHIRKAEGEETSLNTTVEKDISDQGFNNIDSFRDLLVKVDGTIRLRGGHFLHLDIDLAYFFESIPESFINIGLNNPSLNYQPTNFARLKETRKVKLNELHYFDHPLFGVIMRVRRLITE